MSSTVSRPGCVVFLIEESAALQGKIIDGNQSKQAMVTTCLNAALQQLTAGPNFEVAVVGYRTDAHGQPNVGTRWGGALAGQTFVPVRELGATPLRVEKRIRRLPSADPLAPPREEEVSFPIWYEPAAEGGAPQAAAYGCCRQLLDAWSSQAGAGAGIPLVVHVWASNATDADHHNLVDALRQWQGAGGTPVVFHCHLGSAPAGPAVLYPSNRLSLSIGPVRDSFDCASPLPPEVVAGLKEAKRIIHPNARGMVYNARLGDLIQFLSLVKLYMRGWPSLETAAPAVVAGLPQQGPAQAASAGAPADAGQPGRLLVLVVDRSTQSGAAGPSFVKLTQRVNEMLADLARRAPPGLDVCLISYGSGTEVRVGFEGAYQGRPYVSAADLSGAALRVLAVVEEVPNGIGGLVPLERQKPIFFELEPTGAAEPLPAFRAVKQTLTAWLLAHGGAGQPPVVLHLSRGGQKPEEVGAAAAEVAGSALLYHLILTEAPHKSLAYPATSDLLAEDGLRRLWEVSSPLHLSGPGVAGRRLEAGARGFVVNGKFDLLPAVLDSVTA
jgi:hypothetical protein